jgi:hypothetical protein
MRDIISFRGDSQRSGWERMHNRIVIFRNAFFRPPLPRIEVALSLNKPAGEGWEEGKSFYDRRALSSVALTLALSPNWSFQVVTQTRGEGTRGRILRTNFRFSLVSFPSIEIYL